MTNSELTPRVTLRREGSIGFFAGILIGAAAGMIGVGGGEFRIPLLIYVLRLPVRVAAGANTVIGLAVVVLGVIRRWGQHVWSADDFRLAGVMIVASLAGAALGARWANRLPLRPLKVFVIAYLLAVGAWMIVEALLHAEHTLMNPAGIGRWILAAMTGFLIAGISGALGVAGGEMRIPALIYLFGLPIKPAGTVSLLVSIPTVAAAAWTYRRQGHIPNHVLAVAVVTGLGSIVGVLIGAALLPYVDTHALKALLGVVLLAATACLVLPWIGERRSSRPE
jgi:uncharacterized membrane protein YfcA